MAAAAMVAQKKISNRLCSLDAFRGLAIVTMVFANAGCGKYHWIEHATWNGIHPADFIFPSFLWYGIAVAGYFFLYCVHYSSTNHFIIFHYQDYGRLRAIFS